MKPNRIEIGMQRVNAESVNVREEVTILTHWRGAMEYPLG
jgi:hypothetical protein